MINFMRIRKEERFRRLGPLGDQFKGSPALKFAEELELGFDTTPRVQASPSQEIGHNQVGILPRVGAGGEMMD